MCSRHIPRCHLKRIVCKCGSASSCLCHHCGHKHLQPVRRRAWVRLRLLVLSCSSVSVLGTLDLPTDRSRTAFLVLHLVHTFQFERFATVVVALFLVDNFENTPSFSCPHHFFFPSCDPQLRVKPYVDSPFALRALWRNHLHPALDLQMQFSNSDRTITNHLTFYSTQHCYHKWCRMFARCF